MQNEQEKADYVAQTIATYNAIAPDYKLTATPEMRAWEENSMRRFNGYLAGKRVLVPGCGDGRDSRFLRSLGLAITSFDLSEEMLKIAAAQDPQGTIPNGPIASHAFIQGVRIEWWKGGVSTPP